MSGLTKEQLAIRKNKLTGSTIAAYLGYSPYQSPSEAWEINEGKREFAGNQATRFGEIFEDAIGIAACEELGIPPEDVSKPDSMPHPDYQEAIVVHPDLLCKKRKLGIQIKNHDPRMMKDYGKPTGGADNKLVPKHYLMQCMLEHEVVRATFGKDWDWWYLAAYFGGTNLRLYKLRYDPIEARKLMKEALAFWRAYLDPKGMKFTPDDEAWEERFGK